MESLMDKVNKIKDLAVARDNRQESLEFIRSFLDNEVMVPITHAKVKDIVAAALAYIEQDKSKAINEAQEYYYSIFEALEN